MEKPDHGPMERKMVCRRPTILGQTPGRGADDALSVILVSFKESTAKCGAVEFWD